MATNSATADYFTKHLFGAGLQCPTKLYYKAHDFPEDQTSVPFIRHAVHNKRLLKALARSVYPDGKFIEADSVADAASSTDRHLQAEHAVLFDAIFEYRQMMARLPIVVKNQDSLTAFHIQTKVFDSRKYRLADAEGNIYQKWQKYITDFAYQLYLVQQKWPNYRLKAVLVLPEKTGQAKTDNLPFLLKPLDKTMKAVSVPSANQQLLAKINVTDLINRVWTNPAFAENHLPESSFEDSLYYLRDLYLNKQKEAPQVGSKCKDCEFRIERERIPKGVKSGFNECWNSETGTENPSEKHVFDLIGPGVNNWIENGIYHQQNIPEDEIFASQTIVNGSGRITHNMRQALQVFKAKGQQVPPEIMRPELYRELNRWEYPLHFLDFEAGNYPVPVRRNRSPYHLLVFQFSCHTLTEDGSWRHHQWIDDLESGYPNYELVRQLMDVPDINEGTIVQYSDFERNALKTIRRELMDEQDEVKDATQLIRWIEKIIHRNDSSHHQPPYVADLSRLVKHFYYNREMDSSLSIKDVLQSVMSHSTVLKKQYSSSYSSHNFDDIIWWEPDGQGGARNPYEILAETDDHSVRRGTEAMVEYGKLIAQELSPEQLKLCQQALLKYCELDTLAMLMIYQHWKGIMAQDS